MTSTVRSSALRLDPAQVVFVCGPYKSGTSLATLRLEQAGLSNPVHMTSPVERAFGLSMSRYETRECRIVRGLNDQRVVTSYGGLLPQADVAAACRAGTEGRAGRGARDLLDGWAGPLVLKDPRFVYTLSLWIGAARAVGRAPRALFTWREPSSMRRAWDAAPYTRRLLRVGALRGMLAAQREQVEMCRRAGIPFGFLGLDDLQAGVIGDAGTPTPAILDRTFGCSSCVWQPSREQSRARS